jgi:hypothetical protein
MYVVRLRSIDDILDYKAFTSRALTLSTFEAGQNQVIDERLGESTLFDATSADDAKTAIQFAREGRASLLRIYPPPMTEVQARGLASRFRSLKNWNKPLAVRF